MNTYIIILNNRNMSTKLSGTVTEIKLLLVTAIKYKWRVIEIKRNVVEKEGE